MAGRKPKKGLDWFPHDVGYGRDDDIEVLIANYGQDGYAYPLHMYERAYNTRSGELDISEAEKRQVYARSCLISLDLWEQITQTCVKSGIWDREAYEKRHVLTSDRIKAQMAPVLKKRKESQVKYRTTKTKKPPSKSAPEMPPENTRNGQSKEEKTILNNKKENISPEALRLSGILAHKILENNAENRELQAGKKEATIIRWAVDIDKMIKDDKRVPELIQKVILWCQSDAFWHKNILSGKKLRDKYDRLTLDMAGGGGNGRYGKPSYDDAELQSIKERRARERGQEETVTDGTS